MIKLIIEDLDENYEKILKCLCDFGLVDLSFKNSDICLTLDSLEIQCEVIPDEQDENEDLQSEKKNKGLFW